MDDGEVRDKEWKIALRRARGIRPEWRAPIILGMADTILFDNMTHGFIRLNQTKNGKARALPFNETLWSLFSGLRSRHDVPWCFTMQRDDDTMIPGTPLRQPVRKLA
jgi:hypothetical protein